MAFLMRFPVCASILFGLAFVFGEPLGWAAESADAKRATAGKGKQARGAGGQWWQEIDTGPFLADTITSGGSGAVVALKGLAIRLGARRTVTAVFDTELLTWRAGFDGALVLAGTPWDGSNSGNSHYPAGGDIFYFQNPTGLGFALNGSWQDTRGFKAGPLPKAVGRYLGLFRHGGQTVVHYQIAGTRVLELPALEKVGEGQAITRTVNVEDALADIELLVRGATLARDKVGVAVYLVGAPRGVSLQTAPDGRTAVAIARGTPRSRFKIVIGDRPLDLANVSPPGDLAELTRGGGGLFPQSFAVKGQLDPEAAKKTYAVDVIPLPVDNPWKSPPRFGGFDFFPDGKRIAASTWNGDVWIAEGIDGDLSKVTWRRFASGLYQTLGLKIVDGVVYTQGRDQITRLRDLNGDGEADSYECFNNDVMITAGFHEFSFDLETDRAGNFYFSKAMPVNGGGRGFMPWTPHNGTVMKVSADGSRLEVVAWGFRAPGGVGVSPDGVVTTGENEGSWVPACKISWSPPGQLTFNGVVPSKWETRSVWGGALPGAPTDYDRPLCWIPYYADNSSGSQAWVPAATTWDPRHAGEMLHLSYGKSSVFRVLRETVNGVTQGGVYRLPIEVSAAVMRARFHPQNGQLYVMGFRGWQTNGRDAFQRVRYTGVTTPVPVELHAHRNGLRVRFSAPLDRQAAEDPSRYSISKWNYVWGPQYGSGRFSIDQRDDGAEAKAITVPSKGAHNRIDTVPVAAAKLLEDGRTVFLYIPQMTPAMQMELKLDLVDLQGVQIRETIYHTVHQCAPEFKIAGLNWADVKVVASVAAGEPGLALSFNAEITDTLRVDQLALTVAAGTSPSVFITPKAGAFGAAFQGTLIAPERDDFTFSLEGVGEATLSIDGQIIVSGTLPLLAKVPVTLPKGPHGIFCSYQSMRSGEGRVRLMWSSPQFRTEPVPASVFRFMPGSEMASWGKVRAGREIFAQAMCIKCHQPRNGVSAEYSPEFRTSAPDFDHIGRRLEAGWLEQWVRSPQGFCPTIAATVAADVAAYLAGQKEAGGGLGALSMDASLIAAGAALVDKLQFAPWVSPLLAGKKHTAEGLVDFLQYPAKHHPDTVFPDLRLSVAEAQTIAAYVRSRQPVAPLASPGEARRGQAVVAAVCVACHVSAAVDAAERDARPTALSLEEIARSDWSARGCVAENRGQAPNYRFTRAQVTALEALRQADRDVGMQSLRRFSAAEYAANQVKALQCAQCHSGGGDQKVPDITFAGEKFDAGWLGDLLAGKHVGKIRPWQDGRMPAFASRAANVALGLAARQGVPAKTATPVAEPAWVSTGGALAGETGYSCLACHDAGSRKALQVFEGQGPNLQLAGQRLRYDYFERWMHWPQRISPTTIMPRYTKDRDHALLNTPLEGDAAQQFAAIWHWMRQLEPPR